MALDRNVIRVAEVEKLKGQVADLVDLLKACQKHCYHQPNSDFMEYCNGCRRSPYNHPPHAEGCLVVRIQNAVSAIEKDNKEEKK